MKGGETTAKRSERERERERENQNKKKKNKEKKGKKIKSKKKRRIQSTSYGLPGSGRVSRSRNRLVSADRNTGCPVRSPV